MDTHFDIIRQNNKKLYINKNFRNTSFEQALLVGLEYLQKHFKLTVAPSSLFCRVYKSVVPFNNVDTPVYLKQHLSRGIWDTIKHTIRPGRAKREFNASLMLQNNGFDSPTVIALLEHRLGPFRTDSLLITKEVENAKPIPKFLADSRPNHSRNLIESFGQTIGQMHARGIFHGDLRLGNVLASREKNVWRFFLLDNERTKKFRKLPDQLRVKNLVQLQMPTAITIGNTDRMRFYKKYAAENAMGKNEQRTLAEKVLKKTFRRLHGRVETGNRSNRYLKTNKDFLHIEKGEYLAMFDRSFCEGVEPFDFIEQIDTLMNKGQIFKNDQTSCVSRLMWNGRDIMVKRYNHKGFIHSLRHTIKGSRARRAWLNAHRLRMLGIATPKPLAYIEQRKKPFVWKSYLVTEYVRGPNLKRLLQDNNITEEKWSMITQQVTDIVGKLGKYLITHGDLKHSNILITENGPVLTDLDVMKFRRFKYVHRWKAKHDFALSSKNLSACNRGGEQTGA